MKQTRGSGMLALSVLLILIINMDISNSEIDAASMEKVNKFEGAEIVLAKKLDSFAEKLHKIVGSLENNKQNVIFSPLSIHSALSMLSAGVKSGSLAEETLMRTLGYTDKAASKETLHNAYEDIMSHFKFLSKESEQIVKDNKNNSEFWALRKLVERPPVLDFWTMGVVDKIQLKDKFRDTLQKKYNTSIKQVTNKEEANKLAIDVNNWGKEAGFGGDVVQPKDLIVKDPQNLILLSAVKIQGFWQKVLSEFEIDDLFYNLGDPKKLVNGTVLNASDFIGNFAIFTKNKDNEGLKDVAQADDELDALEFRMAEIPLIGDMTFTIIEPLNNGSLDELGKLESALLAEGQSSLLEKATHKLSVRRERFESLQFPKFKFESAIDLNNVFDKMGLGILFSEKADLTEISGSPMALSDAKHQAVIEVDKNGLKGGALTRIEIMLLSLNTSPRQLRFIVKNPFLFVVRYKSLTLFMGHVLQI